jgi:hypothetical protein
MLDQMKLIPTDVAWKNNAKQDALLVESVTHLSRKVLDLMEICLGNGISLDYVKTYTH